MSVHPIYDRLAERFARRAVLDDAQAMLHWDMAAVMPEGGAEARARQLALLKSLSHALVADPEIKRMLDAADSESLDDWQRANLAEMRREWIHAAAVPGPLVDALSRAASACDMVWRKARAASDFVLVAPYLAEVVRLTREVAAAKSQALGVSPYDALLDQFEPGGRSAAIDVLFADLEAFLPGFLRDVLDRRPALPPAPTGPFPVDKQKALGLRVMGAMGFEFDHGRLDVSEHPFCGGIPDDVRITTRYDEGDFLKSLFGVIHETGHALYERGLPRDWRDQPVGRARSMSLHESQSLMMEMQLCRSPDFIAFAQPLMAEAFGGSGPAWTVEALSAQVGRVEPGFIRVDADEVTYPAHVILRYRLEKALVAGEIDVQDIPAAWNEASERLLGLTPPDDRLGCLQDIHWYGGDIGYFPTYSLGAMTAAQLAEAARRENPDVQTSLRQGDFSPMLSWLRRHVHSLGSSLSTEEILVRATGKPLDTAAFKAHLTQRYRV